MTTPTTNLTDEQRDALIASVVGVIKTELGLVLEGATDDLEAFGAKIAERTLIAAASGDDELVDELKAQVRVLAEQQRLRTSGAGWAIAEAVVPAIVKIAVGALRAVAL